MLTREEKAILICNALLCLQNNPDLVVEFQSDCVHVGYKSEGQFAAGSHVLRVGQPCEGQNFLDLLSDFLPRALNVISSEEYLRVLEVGE